MPLPTASGDGDLNSHPDLSTSVMLVIVLHPCTKFEVRGPSRSEAMADFRTRR